MKIRMFLLMAFFCFSGALFANDVERDEMMWECAYRGEYSLVHKMHLARPCETVNDEMTNQFVMAYVYYRMGKYEELDAIFQGIDRYFDNKINFQEVDPDVLE